MVALENYKDRLPSYVKHIFLEHYLDVLFHKIASKYSHIVYVDGFAGPWQSTNEKLNDTSFGIALNALRRAKKTWESKREVCMSAFLVEQKRDAYEKLKLIPEQYPDVTIKTYPADFLVALSDILENIPANAFAFFLIDPKGWRIPLKSLQPLLARPNSEVVFNFMFEFINRATGIREPVIIGGLDELMPYGDWRAKFSEAENIARAQNRDLTPSERKTILVDIFSMCLSQLGKYEYVAETTVLRSLKDRPLYCLFYATRNPLGIEVFRNCQVKALTAQSKTRATTKIKHAETNSRQGEFFQSLHDMGPDELASFLQSQRQEAEGALLELTPVAPLSIPYEKLLRQVLARYVIKRPEINEIVVRLYRRGRLLFPDWEGRKRVPQPNYRTQRP